ncbi:MAG: MCE family protein [Actinomycetes bacterium]
MTPLRRFPNAVRVAALAAVVALVPVLSGCQAAGLLSSGVSLPGGAAGGDDVYRVTAVFADVMDLVPQSAVKVNEVTVGTVESVALDGWKAKAVLRLPDSVQLPANATAELRQTSLLGEKYVELSPPATGAQGRLADGAVIPLGRSDRTPEVEEVLGALSALLNGGGVAQLKTINVELAKAMSGRESDLRDLVTQLDTFVGGLDKQTSEIVRALESVDKLSARLAQQRGTITTALDSIPGGLRVLADQRQQLTAMLTGLQDLGAKATGVIRASTSDTAANLRALQPVLARLVEAGQALPDSLDLLVTYPFPRNAATAVVGDYTNLDLHLRLNLRDLAAALGLPDTLPSLPSLPAVPSTPPLPGLPTTVPSLPPLPSLPGVPGLPTTLPTTLPTALPTGLPTCVPGLTCPSGASGGSSGGGSGRSVDDGLAGLLGGGLQ